MPQERLDRIKAAWMERFNKTEDEWLNFHPVSQKIDLIATVSPGNSTSAGGWESKNQVSRIRVDARYLTSTQKGEKDDLGDFHESSRRQTYSTGSGQGLDDAVLDDESDGPSLCPTWEEISFRQASRARSELLKARNYGRSPMGIKSFRDALSSVRIAKMARRNHINVITMIKGVRHEA